MSTFRIDDVGASTKYYNQHGKKVFKWRGLPIFYYPLANVWFFKRAWPFKQWAPYEEITKEEWLSFLEIFASYNIAPIISITAAWVDKSSVLAPFPEKFPGQAGVLKEALQRDRIVVANHGLTHCVVGEHLPRFWRSNRKEHREFWPHLPQEVHTEHILRSQEILEGFFERPITLFVPPGNVWSQKTYQALLKTNIKKVISGRYMMDSNQPMQGIEFVSDRQGFFNFHDRELKLHGKEWLLLKMKDLAVNPNKT